MEPFKNKSEYTQWKNSDNAPYPGSHAIECDAIFDYWINNIKGLFEDSDLKDIGKGIHEVNKQLLFAYTIFNKGIDIGSCNFLYYFGLFNNCEFNSRVCFNNNIFEKEFDISNAHFNDKNIVPILIRNCHFRGIAKFNEIESNRVIIIADCVFEQTVDFGSCTLCENITIQSCTFNGGANFSNTKFNKKLYFLNNKIDGILNFSNCEFNSTAKVVDTKGDLQKVLFSLATIRGMLQFNGWNEKMYLSQNALIDFTHAFIEPTGYVIIRNVNNESSDLTGLFDFSCANIIGHVVMTDVYAKQLNLADSSIIGSFNPEKLYFKANLHSQTYVRLKNEALKRNDSIRAMRYKAKEMSAYKNELDSKKSPQNRNERILLWLNSISNNNGQKWGRALKFTISCWIGFYLLFLIISRIHAIYDLFVGNNVSWTIAKDISNMFSYLWSVDFLSPLSEWVSKCHIAGGGFTASITLLQIVVASLIFIIGKIAIGYGIYQTISAFRKYGK